jgi:hypothetical protein
VIKTINKTQYLKMKDARIVLLEVLVPGHHPVKQLLIQSKGGNGCQEPAVTCTAA